MIKLQYFNYYNSGTSGTIPTRKPIRLESLNPNAPEPMDVKINSVKL